MQKPIDETSKAGGELIIPRGVFYTGSIVLKSNIIITLNKGAVWKGIADTFKYKYFEQSQPSSYDYNKPWRVFIFGDGLENI